MQQSRLVRLSPVVQPGSNRFRLGSSEHSHAVVALHPSIGDFIPGRHQGHQWELGILNFRFLQAQDIGFLLVQPFEHDGQPLTQ
jgi:hypothetical protein